MAGDLPVGIGFRAEWGVGLQFGIWVLRQVGHHGQFIHIGVDHLLGFDQLELFWVNTIFVREGRMKVKTNCV